MRSTPYGYRVQATVTIANPGPLNLAAGSTRYETQFGLPSFVLETDVLGLTGELHAEDLARRMLRSLVPAAGISLSVVPIERS